MGSFSFPFLQTLFPPNDSHRIVHWFLPWFEKTAKEKSCSGGEIALTQHAGPLEETRRLGSVDSGFSRKNLHLASLKMKDHREREECVEPDLLLGLLTKISTRISNTDEHLPPKRHRLSQTIVEALSTEPRAVS